MNNEKRSEYISDRISTMPGSMIREVRDGVINAIEAFFYSYLVLLQGSSESLLIGVETMMEDTGYSAAQISRMLKNLEDAGHISRKRRPQTTTETRCLTGITGDTR